MIVKVSSESEITAVGEFYDRAVKYLDEHINYPKWTYKVYPSEDSVREKALAGSQFMFGRNGQVVGAFVLNDDPQGVYENVMWNKPLERGEYMVCHTLAAEPNMQGKGIGKQMVSFCIKYAMEHGYKAIRLDVVPDNIPARRLYEKCGFQYAGDVDLERGIAEIPLFSMYELNF